MQIGGDISPWLGNHVKPWQSLSRLTIYRFDFYLSLPFKTKWLPWQPSHRKKQKVYIRLRNWQFKIQPIYPNDAKDALRS